MSRIVSNGNWKWWANWGIGGGILYLIFTQMLIPNNADAQRDRRYFIDQSVKIMNDQETQIQKLSDSNAQQLRYHSDLADFLKTCHSDMQIATTMQAETLKTQNLALKNHEAILKTQQQALDNHKAIIENQGKIISLETDELKWLRENTKRPGGDTTPSTRNP
jgi:hypothetical protein